jgi:DNA mismatch repair ATPase MutL
MGKIAITTSGVKQSLSNYNALKSICEYIWNGFDADANKIEITILRNNLGGISEISIKDNGVGIAKKTIKQKI